MRWRFAALPLLLLLTLLLAVAHLTTAQSDPSVRDELEDADDLERLEALLDEAERLGIELSADDAVDELAGLARDDVPTEDVDDTPPKKATKPVVQQPEPAPAKKVEPVKTKAAEAKNADPSAQPAPPKTPPKEDPDAAARRTAKRLEELEKKRADDVRRAEEETARRGAQRRADAKAEADANANAQADAHARVADPDPTEDDVAPAPAPRARMLLDESGEGYAADAAARAQLERDAARRSLLTLPSLAITRGGWASRICPSAFASRGAGRRFASRGTTATRR